MQTLQTIAYRLAELLDAEGARSLQEASDELQATATRMYLDALDWDVEIVINARDVRDMAQYGRTHQSLIEMELYELAEAALAPLVEVEQRRLADDLALSRRVDEEIERRKERAA